VFILTFAVIGLSVFFYIRGMKTTLVFLSVFLSANLFGQNVYIPDANFKAYLVENSWINTNGDLEIQESEAKVYDDHLDCGFRNFSDLTGIEAFTNIKTLVCSGNQFASLDLSQNTALNLLRCGQNEQLTSLDLGQNTALIKLWCEDNEQLTSLDLSQNTALTEIYCHSSQLTSLNLGQNTALTTLVCSGNQLTSLDLSQNTALTKLNCSFNQLTSLDLDQNTSLTKIHCHSNQLTSLDVSQNTALTYLECSDNLFECVVGCKEECDLTGSKRCN
jgi:hypothetical protein